MAAATAVVTAVNSIKCGWKQGARAQVTAMAAVAAVATAAAPSWVTAAATAAARAWVTAALVAAMAAVQGDNIKGKGKGECAGAG
jgi:hypothetical protein